MLLLILLFLLFSAVLIYAFFRRNSFPGIPGPTLRDYFPGGVTHAFLADPKAVSATFLRLSEIHGDVYQMYLGLNNVLITSNPQDIIHLNISRAFARTPNVKATLGMLGPNSLFVMPDDVHSKARSIIRPTFNNHATLETYHDIMTDSAGEVCDQLMEHTTALTNGSFSEPVDISVELSASTLSNILNIAFGLKYTIPQRLEMAHVVEEILHEMLGDITTYPVRHKLERFGTRAKYNGACRKLDKLCEGFLEKRFKESKMYRSNRKEDVLDAILNAFNDDITVVTSLVSDFIIGGFHTTNSTIAWCLFETCKDPHVVVKIEEEIRTHFKDLPLSEKITVEDLRKVSYLKKVWKETLRLHPAVPGTFHLAEQDVTLRGSGVQLKKGSTIFAHTVCAMKSGRYWTDPMQFDPERWGSDGEKREGDSVPAGVYLPFSLGKRNCPGQFLASYEGVLTLAELHRRFKFQLGCDASEVRTASLITEDAEAMWPDGKIRGPPIQVCRRTGW